MSVSLSINKSTGQLKLSIVDTAFEKLPQTQQSFLADSIIPMLVEKPYLVLTGSLALKVLGFEEMSRVGDFDFAATRRLVEADYRYFLERWGMVEVPTLETFEQSKAFEHSSVEQKVLWKFSKTVLNENQYLDILRAEIALKKDVLELFWKDQKFNVIYPIRVWGYRLRFALDFRNNKRKYWDYIHTNLLDKNIVAKNMKIQEELFTLQTLARVYNSTIVEDKVKLQRAQKLITQMPDIEIGKLLKEVLNSDAYEQIVVKKNHLTNTKAGWI